MKKRIALALVFSKNEEKHFDLLFIGEERKCFLSKILIHHVWLNIALRKNYCYCYHYCLQVFSKEEILKCHVKDCFKINGKERIRMPKKGEYLTFKNNERKIKSPFMIYADFESILVPEDNRKQNPDESYTKKYQKNIACSYDYKLVCVDDKFSNPFNSCLGEYVVYSFSAGKIEESKCCSDVMKKHFNEEHVVTKKDDEGFENFTKCCSCENNYVDDDVIVRDHCHIPGKYRGSAHRDCNIKVTLNHKIPIVFHNLNVVLSSSKL